LDFKEASSTTNLNLLSPNNKANLNVLNSIQNVMKLSKKDISVKKYESNNFIRPFTANFPENLNIRNKLNSGDALMNKTGFRFNNNKLLYDKGIVTNNLEKKNEVKKIVTNTLTIFDFKK
jgi:hypothetical protein